MRKPTADQMVTLLHNLEQGMRASLPEGHPCRTEAPPSHQSQWRLKGNDAAYRLGRSGLREEAVAAVSAKLREEAAVRSAQRVGTPCDDSTSAVSLRSGSRRRASGL